MEEKGKKIVQHDRIERQSHCGRFGWPMEGGVSNCYSPSSGAKQNITPAAANLVTPAAVAEPAFSFFFWVGGSGAGPDGRLCHRLPTDVPATA